MRDFVIDSGCDQPERAWDPEMILEASAAPSGRKRNEGVRILEDIRGIKEPGGYYEFGPFQLISMERQLLCEGNPVPITDKAFETLLALVGRRGHLVDKSELFATVWRDSYVEEGNLTVTISMIRKALGDDRKNPKYIQTIPKRGYRFVAATRLMPTRTSTF